MADLSHERARLHAAVDAFIESCEEYDYDDLHIDTFGLVSIGTWNSGEEKQLEAPFQWFESTRLHVQLGILNTCLLEIQTRYFVDKDDDNEDDED